LFKYYNGVDEIRDLREKANLVPTNSKYKVYIIDEVHMLTTQAFNALLKTLEEPPKHVIFVLATTEYYKIPLTITSRCQKFQFNKISNNDIVERLKKISLLEKIDIDDDALMEIAKISDGGMRDSINFLDQLRSFNDGKITLNDVYDVCGNVSSQEIVDLFVDICNNNAEKITNFFETMDLNGKNYGKFFEDVISFLKDVVLVKREVDYKYIKSNIEDIKKIANLFTLDNIFYMIVFINKLLGRLSSVSRQSVIVIANFLLMMDRINSIYEVKKVNDKVKKTHDNENEEFIKFTSSRKENSDNLTDNIDVKDDKVLNDSNDLIPKISVKNKEIIINNTFAVASKVIKNNLQSKFSMISDYLTDKKFTSIVGTLIDTTIEVAGDNYLILSAKSDLIVDKIYSNYRLCNEFLKMIFNSEYNFVVINNNEWNNYRDEYIKNIRSGKKYELKELDDNNLIQELVSASEPTIVDKLFDLVGEDSVEFK